MDSRMQDADLKIIRFISLFSNKKISESKNAKPFLSLTLTLALNWRFCYGSVRATNHAFRHLRNMRIYRWPPSETNLLRLNLKSLSTSQLLVDHGPGLGSNQLFWTKSVDFPHRLKSSLDQRYSFKHHL